jgi:hypothetical protein
MRTCAGLIVALSVASSASAFSFVQQPAFLQSSGAFRNLCTSRIPHAAPQFSGRIALRRSQGICTVRAQEIGIMEGSGPVRKVANFGLWAAFLAFATFLAPDVRAPNPGIQDVWQQPKLREGQLTFPAPSMDAGGS